MKSRENIQTMTKIAAVTAIVVICAWISFPMPTGVSTTLQTFGIALCGFILGPKLSAVSIILYWAMGAVGLPVFSSFGAGIGQFAGPTGGFLWGFLFLAVLCGVGERAQNKVILIALAILGLAICHFLGVIQFAALTERTWTESFVLVSVPYLIKDVVSVVVAWLLGNRITVALKKAKLA